MSRAESFGLLCLLACGLAFGSGCERLSIEDTFASDWFSSEPTEEEKFEAFKTEFKNKLIGDYTTF